MKWQESNYNEQTSETEVPGTWLYIHYYEALNVLFRVENGLRVFVYVVLKNEFHEKWADISIDSDDAEPTTVNAIAKKRMAQAKNFGYLGYSITCPILHLTSGELIRIITTDTYWKYFAKYFPGSREIMKNKLDEIGTIRNSLAHFRPIKRDDVALIKQNARHVLAVVEDTLGQLMSCSGVVPSNTSASWYRELRTVGTDVCTLSFSQSSDECWIKLSVNMSCEILSTVKTGANWIHYHTLKLLTPAILKEYSQIRNAVIFLAEDVPYTPMPADLNPELKKEVAFVFSRICLEESYKEIKTSLEQVLLKIKKEADLIKEDNLARGDLVEMVAVTARFMHQKPEAGTWNLDLKPLNCSIKHADPPEYWGEFTIFGTENLISDMDRYPWMPTDVASVPF